MQITVIGSGNAFNTDGRAHACYLLEAPGGERLLLDCGATSLYRLHQERLDPCSLTQIVLTHFHGDHYGGLPFLLLDMHVVGRRETPLTILGPPGVEAACAGLLDATYPGFELRFPVRYVELPCAGDRAGPGAEIEDGAFALQPFPVTHKEESTGYRIRAKDETGVFCFSGDAGWDEKLFALVKNTDLAIIELTMEFQSEPPVAHVALDELRTDRNKLQTKRLILSHIYDDLARKVQAASLGEAAFDGMRLPL